MSIDFLNVENNENNKSHNSLNDAKNSEEIIHNSSQISGLDSAIASLDGSKDISQINLSPKKSANTDKSLSQDSEIKNQQEVHSKTSKKLSEPSSELNQDNPKEAKEQISDSNIIDKEVKKSKLADSSNLLQEKDLDPKLESKAKAKDKKDNLEKDNPKEKEAENKIDSQKIKEENIKDTKIHSSLTEKEKNIKDKKSGKKNKIVNLDELEKSEKNNEEESLEGQVDQKSIQSKKNIDVNQSSTKNIIDGNDQEVSEQVSLESPVNSSSNSPANSSASLDNTRSTAAEETNQIMASADLRVAEVVSDESQILESEKKLAGAKNDLEIAASEQKQQISQHEKEKAKVSEVQANADLAEKPIKMNSPSQKQSQIEMKIQEAPLSQNPEKKLANSQENKTLSAQTSRSNKAATSMVDNMRNNGNGVFVISVENNIRTNILSPSFTPTKGQTRDTQQAALS